MQPRNAVWVALGIFAVALGVMVGAFARTDSVRAQEPAPQLVTCQADFPSLGIRRLEEARVNASWVEGEGDPIDVRIQFIDRTGAVLQESAHALSPGETVSVDLAEGRSDTAERLDFRAAVLLMPGSGGPGFPAENGCPQVVTSLERLYKQTTTLVLTPGSPIVPRPCRSCAPPSPPPTDVPPPGDTPFPGDVPPPSDFSFPVDLRPIDMPPFSVDVQPPPVIDMPPFPVDVP